MVSAFDGFYSVDLATRQADTLGATGIYAGQLISIEGMAYGPDLRLYGVSDNLKSLFRIDARKGDATVIGSLAVPGQSLTTNLDTSLAITGDGRFWMASATVGALYRVDPNTGKASLVGPLGAKITGLAARHNELFGVGSRGDEGLYRIDTTTGAATLLHRFGASISYAATISIAFDVDGSLWAIVNYNPPQSDNGPIATWSDLARIDPDSGSVELLGAITGPNNLKTIPIRGAAIIGPNGFLPPVNVPVPAVSTWSALVLAFALVAGTAWRRRRPSRR